MQFYRYYLTVNSLGRPNSFLYCGATACSFKSARNPEFYIKRRKYIWKRKYLRDNKEDFKKNNRMSSLTFFFGDFTLYLFYYLSYYFYIIYYFYFYYLYFRYVALSYVKGIQHALYCLLKVFSIETFL